MILTEMLDIILDDYFHCNVSGTLEPCVLASEVVRKMRIASESFSSLPLVARNHHLF